MAEEPHMSLPQSQSSTVGMNIRFVDSEDLNHKWSGMDIKIYIYNSVDKYSSPKN